MSQTNLSVHLEKHYVTICRYKHAQVECCTLRHAVIFDRAGVTVMEFLRFLHRVMDIGGTRSIYLLVTLVSSESLSPRW